MADEAVTTGTEEQTTTTEQKPADLREVFGRQINEMKAQNEALQAQIAAAKQAEADRAEQDALKRGEHEQVIAQLKAKMEAQQAAADKAQRELRLTQALANAGVADALSVAGAIALYDGETDMSQYAASVAEQRQAAGVKPLSPPGTATPATSGRLSGQQLKQQLQDPNTRGEAAKYVEMYYSQHGRFPDGFES